MFSIFLMISRKLKEEINNMRKQEHPRHRLQDHPSDFFCEIMDEHTHRIFPRFNWALCCENTSKQKTPLISSACPNYPTATERKRSCTTGPSAIYNNWCKKAKLLNEEAQKASWMLATLETGFDRKSKYLLIMGYIHHDAQNKMQGGTGDSSSDCLSMPTGSSFTFSNHLSFTYRYILHNQTCWTWLIIRSKQEKLMKDRYCISID